MAAVTYYMYVTTADNYIHNVNQTGNFAGGPPNFEIRSASFSASAGDSPDVVTPAGKPTISGSFIAPNSYTPPTFPAMKVTYTGDVSQNPNDNKWDLTANGLNKATITFQKWDKLSQENITESGDQFSVCVLGPLNYPNTPVGIATMDAQGQIVLEFTPGPTEKGELGVLLNPVNTNYGGKAMVRFI